MANIAPVSSLTATILARRWPVSAAQTYSSAALAALRVLGSEVARARRARRWTSEQLAERAGVSRVKLRRIEQGAPSVAIGTVFEVAALLGIELFGAAPERWGALAVRADERLRVLPARVRPDHDSVHDDF
jgi:DNA-binding XRE family transcriptional regulator